MAIDKELLELLACPACGGQARVEVTGAGDGLQCVACQRVYPIREGIPVMLIEEAKQPVAANA
jgi:uncharacterized protein YbaR (Trm112 family)